MRTQHFLKNTAGHHEWRTSVFACKNARRVNGSVLAAANQEKDLGVWVSNELCWKKQLVEQTSKANKLLGFVRRSSHTKPENKKMSVPLCCTTSPWLRHPDLGPSNHRAYQASRKSAASCNKIHTKPSIPLRTNLRGSTTRYQLVSGMNILNI